MFPSPCDSHHANMVWHLHIYFRMISVQTALYSHIVGFVGGTGPAIRLSSICNGVTWPADSTLLPETAQVFLKAPV